jgi:hypothetical protein
LSPTAGGTAGVEVGGAQTKSLRSRLPPPASIFFVLDRSSGVFRRPTLKKAGAVSGDEPYHELLSIFELRTLRGITPPFPATPPLPSCAFILIPDPSIYISVTPCLVFFLTPPILRYLADEGSLDEDAGLESPVEVGNKGGEVGE